MRAAPAPAFDIQPLASVLGRGGGTGSISMLVL